MSLVPIVSEELPAPEEAWERLLGDLSARDRDAFARALRRSIAGRLVRVGNIYLREVPESIRSQAVGTWRKRQIEHGASKSATRRKGYAQLAGNAEYREIERALLGRRIRAIQKSFPGLVVDLDHLDTASACALYRSMGPRFAGSALSTFAYEVCNRAVDQIAHGDDLTSDLVDRVCAFARAEDLSTCATVQSSGADHFGRGRSEAFHLRNVCTEEEVADRIASTHLVEGVLRKLYAGKDAHQVLSDRLLAEAMKQAEVVAIRALLARLFSTDDPLHRMLGRLADKTAQKLLAQVDQASVFGEVTRAVLNNPRYQRQFERSVELRLRVRKNVPETPMEAYPLARTMQRNVVLHVGPTNSGKTHDAIEALRAASSGVYLGPLRLLAYEQFELLNREGCPCSLLTGEESVEVAGAHHVSSTVEMADYQRSVEVAVIDEAQMLADPDRGQRWTAAILGIPAYEVHICCAPHAESVVRELVSLCEDELEVVRHERLVPLVRDKGSFRMPGDVKPGDALIVFSRKEVHAVAAEVNACGLRASMVYGALPYEVRHEEARRFDEGETDVVVATDAIGMGMNLPIRRIVFVEQKKFDGHELRALLPEEIQQIAGRAGRYGRYDMGLYQSTRRRNEIFWSYGQVVPDITEIPVGIPYDIALVSDASLSESVRQWMALEQPEPFVRIDVTRELELLAEVEGRLDEQVRTQTDVKLKVLALVTMPFDEDDRRLRRAWREMMKAELAGGEAVLPIPREPGEGADLRRLEEDYRYCDLLYSYARTFTHPAHVEELSVRRSQISSAIMRMLAEGSGPA